MQLLEQMRQTRHSLQNWEPQTPRVVPFEFKNITHFTLVFEFGTYCISNSPIWSWQWNMPASVNDLNWFMEICSLPCQTAGSCVCFLSSFPVGNVLRAPHHHLPLICGSIWCTLSRVQHSPCTQVNQVLLGQGSSRIASGYGQTLGKASKRYSSSWGALG